MLTAVVRNPPLKAFHERLRAAGKLPKVALAACMRKHADHAQRHGQNRYTLERLTSRHLTRKSVTQNRCCTPTITPVCVSRKPVTPCGLTSRVSATDWPFLARAWPAVAYKSVRLDSA